MKPYAVLIRGINVGGKNRVPMAALRTCLEELGFSDVSTYIASGNVILRSEQGADQIRERIEKALPRRFRMDGGVAKVLVLTKSQLRTVISKKPKGFGEEPGKYLSDVIFLIDISPAEAMRVFSPREHVDAVWKGKGVVYSQRLCALRTKSRLNQVMGTPEYKSMTIRNWNTTRKLCKLLEAGA